MRSRELASLQIESYVFDLQGSVLSLGPYFFHMRNLLDFASPKGRALDAPVS
jgi:hypothetical protein